MANKSAAILSDKERADSQGYGQLLTTPTEIANKSAKFLSDKERKHFEGYEFPFENLVLEGGGAKLAGAIGTVLVSTCILYLKLKASLRNLLPGLSSVQKES